MKDVKINDNSKFNCSLDSISSTKSSFYFFISTISFKDKNLVFAVGLLKMNFISWLVYIKVSLHLRLREYGIANILEIDYFNYLKSHWNLDPVSVFFNLILAANKN